MAPSRLQCLHLTKLAVGVRDMEHLRSLQAERLSREPPLRHRTRSFPRRRPELIAGGSIYWVINGFLQTRQQILDIIEDSWSDGSACTGLVLDPQLVPLQAKPMKPFQGWRYLNAADAPPDLDDRAEVIGADFLPTALRLELRALCLL